MISGQFLLGLSPYFLLSWTALSLGFFGEDMGGEHVGVCGDSTGRVFTELSWLDISSLTTTELGPLFSSFVKATGLLFIHEILHRIQHWIEKEERLSLLKWACTFVEC